MGNSKSTLEQKERFMVECDEFKAFLNQYCEEGSHFWTDEKLLQSAWVSSKLSGERRREFRASTIAKYLGFKDSGNGLTPVILGMKIIKWPVE